MYMKILVPVALDHPERSKNAVSVARTLAAPGAKIILFHVLEEIPAFVASQIPRDIVAETMKSAQEELEKTAEAAGGDIQVSILHGHASRSILDHAQDNGVDCIVISSHRPGLEDFFLGSTAARVVRHAQCSVHVIRGEE